MKSRETKQRSHSLLDLLNALSSAGMRGDAGMCLHDATNAALRFLGVSARPRTSGDVVKLLRDGGYSYAASEYYSFVKKYAEAYELDPDSVPVVESYV